MCVGLPVASVWLFVCLRVRVCLHVSSVLLLSQTHAKQIHIDTIRTYVPAHLCVFIHMYAYVHTHVCIYICMYVRTYVCMYGFTCTFTCTCMCLCLCLYACCICVCVGVGVCVYIYTFKETKGYNAPRCPNWRGRG